MRTVIILAVLAVVFFVASFWVGGIFAGVIAIALAVAAIRKWWTIRRPEATP